MSDDDRRRELAAGAAALATEVAALNERLVEQNEHIAELTERNADLNQRAKRHSGWILATAAGLALDLALTIVMFVFFDQQRETNERVEATQARLETSVKNQCGLLAVFLGAYRPESRPAEGRAAYEAAYQLIRDSYADLACTVRIVPPATPTTPPAAPR